MIGERGDRDAAWTARRTWFSEHRTSVGALAVAVVGAVVSVVGAFLPVLEDSTRAFASGPWLAALGVAPAVAACALFLLSRPDGTAGVLIGAALLAPAAVTVDLQLLVDPSVAARPELYLPVDLAAPPPAAGLWFVWLAHLIAFVAGVVALVAVRRGLSGHDPEEAEARTWSRKRFLVVLGVAVVAACGLLMTPFSSGDVYLIASNAFEAGRAELVGRLLAAVALPVGAALLLSLGRSVGVVRGGLLGLGCAAVAMAAPGWLAALAVPSLDVAPGPVVASVAALVLVALAARGDSRGRSALGGEVRIPGLRRLWSATGALALLACAALWLGAWTPQLVVTGAAAPESPARWLSPAAGTLLGVLGAALFVPRVAAAVRPALSVVWVGVPLAATAVLDTAMTTTSVPGLGLGGTELAGLVSVDTGPGVLWTWLGMTLSVVAACSAVVAGVVEREDVDDPVWGLTTVGLRMLTPLTAAGVLSVASVVTPMVTAPGYAEPSLWSNVGTPTWGLLAASVVVLGSLVLSTRSRPDRAVASLAGAAGVLGLRAATYPLVGAEIEGSSPGPGLWLSLAAVAALAVAAGTALRGRVTATARPVETSGGRGHTTVA